MYSLWGSSPAQNLQLPSGDYAVAQAMLFTTYQRHRCSTVHIEKDGVANGAQRNPSTTKVHNLSCKMVPRDSSLTATKNSCSQAQTGSPTRSSTGYSTEKLPLQECCSLTPNTFQQIASPGTIQTYLPLQQELIKQRMKNLGQRDLNTCMRDFLERASALIKKTFAPILLQGA